MPLWVALYWTLFFPILSSLLIIGCNVSPSDGTSSRPHPLTILVAASAAESVSAIAAEFEQSTGVPVVVSAGPSNGLAQQVLSGAPANIFISANRQWIQTLSERGLVESAADLFHNRMVLIVRDDFPHTAEDLVEFATGSKGLLAIAGKHVPAGIYAEQILRATGVYEGLQSEHRIVRGSDARVTARYVESGEVDAGIVYATDALRSSAIRIAQQFDAAHHDQITYSAALLKPPGSDVDEDVKTLFDRLRNDVSSYKDFGFQPMAK